MSDVVQTDASNAPHLDIEANRQATKWSRKALAGRVLWSLCLPLFRLSPRPLWGWRNFLLRQFGARVGKGAHVYPTVKITIPWHLSIGAHAAVGDSAILYALGPITIGDRATVSQYAHLCAGSHDFRDKTMALTKLPITIGEDAWVCADAFVGPNVTMGQGSVAGARAVVMKDVPAGDVVGGNPARKIAER